MVRHHRCEQRGQRFDFAKLGGSAAFTCVSMDDAALRKLSCPHSHICRMAALAAGFDDAARERLLRAMPGLRM